MTQWQNNDTGPSSNGHDCTAGQGRISGNRLRTPKNDLGYLLNLVERPRNERVMILGALSFATKKWRYWALVDRPHLHGRPGAQFPKWDKDEEIRNGSLFESRKKALRRKSYGISCANDAKKRLVVCDGEEHKGSRRRLRDWPNSDTEGNDVRLCFAKTWSKTLRFKSLLRVFN